MPKPISYNSDGLQIFAVKHDLEDKVRVGWKFEESQWVPIIYGENRNNFIFNEECYDMEDFLRTDIGGELNE